MVHHSNPASSDSPQEEGTSSQADAIGNVPDEKHTQLTSNVWKYATKKTPQIAVCNLCNRSMKTKNSVTTNVRRHLIDQHGLSILQLAARSSSTSRQRRYPPQTKRLLDTLAIQAIIQDGRSFGDLRKAGIIKFLAEAAPGTKSFFSPKPVDVIRESNEQ